MFLKKRIQTHLRALWGLNYMVLLPIAHSFTACHMPGTGGHFLISNSHAFAYLHSAHSVPIASKALPSPFCLWRNSSRKAQNLWVVDSQATPGEGLILTLCSPRGWCTPTSTAVLITLPWGLLLFPSFSLWALILKGEEHNLGHIFQILISLFFLSSLLSRRSQND